MQKMDNKKKDAKSLIQRGESNERVSRNNIETSILIIAYYSIQLDDQAILAIWHLYKSPLPIYKFVFFNESPRTLFFGELEAFASILKS